MSAGDPLEGRKSDTGKRRFSLFPLEAVFAIVDVLEYGARKYAPGNWRHVSNAKQRYYDAAMRHLMAWGSDEKLDSESGHPHLAHAACCLVLLIALELEPPKPG